MQEQYLILLLQILKNNGGVYSLRKAGLEYSQIASLIHSIEKEGYAENKGDQLVLTGSGLEKLAALNKKFGRKNTEGWISLQEEYRVRKLSKDEIYIPDKRKMPNESR
ncbi:MAG: hypothetical protein WCY09_01770 [Candidatus Omnitrophota bacterium]